MNNKYENIIYPKFVQEFLDMMKVNKHHDKFSLIINDEEMEIMEQIRVPFSHEVGSIIGDSEMNIDSYFGGRVLEIRKTNFCDCIPEGKFIGIDLAADFK